LAKVTEHLTTRGRTASTDPTGSHVGERNAALIIVVLALGIRLLHLASAVTSPFTYQLGADEDFYIRFGRVVAGIDQGNVTEFAFMDPAYGLLLGVLFKVVGPNLFAVYGIQSVLDAFTTYCIFIIGRELGRPRGGLYAAMFYALTCMAVLYSSTALKEIWVANYMTLFVLFSLLLLRTRQLFPWLLFGLLCGYGVALRANLLLIPAAAALLLPWLEYTLSKRSSVAITYRMGIFAVGLACALVLLAVRNNDISHRFSPIPNNGGIVLHQLYNPDNSRSLNWSPSFAAYSNPTEIWNGYAREAERREQHKLTPAQVERYWRRLAFEYILANPLHVIENMAIKLSLFVAYFEIPTNRSLEDERLFSPVLRFLPSPFALLFALGVPGLSLLIYRDRRALVLLIPILVSVATVAVFFAEARFRFHTVPMFALGAGFFIDDLNRWLKDRQTKRLVIGIISALILGTISVSLGQNVQRPETSWGRIVWGYIKMGDVTEAKSLATRIASEQHENATIFEALAFIAAKEKDYTGAAEYYRHVISLRANSHVAYYNLARVLAKTGNKLEAIEQVNLAVQLSPLPEYRQFLERLKSGQRPVDADMGAMPP